MSAAAGSSQKSLLPAHASLSSIKSQLQHESPSPCRRAIPRTTCRSVKSIVAWLESSSTGEQPWPPGNAAADMPRGSSTGSVSSCRQQSRHKCSAPATSYVGDCSLTNPTYQGYLTSASRGRCLSQGCGFASAGACGRLTDEEGHAPLRRKQADADGGSGIDDEQQLGGAEATTGTGLMRRDPDEVTAF